MSDATGVDISREAVERHLDVAHNHEAGLIPVATILRMRALAARLEAVEAERNVQNDLRQIAEDAADEARDKLAQAVEALRLVDAKVSWEINPSNYSHQEVCDMNADWCEIGNHAAATLAAIDA